MSRYLLKRIILFTLLGFLFRAAPAFGQTYLNKSVLSAEGNTNISIMDPGTGGKITFTTEGVERVHIDGNGNVGIGKLPTAKLDVNGVMKVASLDMSNASYVHIFLSHCGGPCGGHHPLNTWSNVSGSHGYSWTQNINTSPDVFTHNGLGTITIHKAGTYQVRLTSMIMPVGTGGVPVYVCPFIGGAVNCNGQGIYTGGIVHMYYQGGVWVKNHHDFVYNLGQGATVGWGYHPVAALSNWAHDSYTALEITELN